MPESYATVVEAGCRCPFMPLGMNPCRSLNPIMTGLAYVVTMRELHVELANTGVDTVVVTVGVDVVATFVVSPGAELASAFGVEAPRK